MLIWNYIDLHPLMSKHLASTRVFDAVKKFEVVSLRRSMNISVQTPEGETHCLMPVIKDQQTKHYIMSELNQNIKLVPFSFQ